MSQLFEYFNTGDSSADDFKSTKWYAQTFTPPSSHKITSVKLKWYRVGGGGGQIGTITVGIRATDGAGKPTGGDLCSGTMGATAVTTVSPGQWYEITLGAGAILSALTKYAIVMRASGGDSSNFIQWRRDGDGYPGGGYGNSNDSGATWTMSTSDGMFEEWGDGSTVTTQDATAIQAFQAAGNGNIPNATNIVERGFEWGTSPGSYPNSVTETGSFSAGAYSLVMSPLVAATAYYFRAKIRNSLYGWSYGAEKNFQSGHDTSLTLYQNWNTGDASANDFEAAKWRTQTFTPSISHCIKSVKVKIYRVGTTNLGNVIVGIRATDGAGKPTGADLCSGTYPSLWVTTSASGQWYEIGFGAGVVLNAAVKYAIVCRTPSGDASHFIQWRQVLGYAGGQDGVSADSGATWAMSTMDNMFEEWGDPSVETYPASDITSAQATGNGFLADPTNIDEIGFEWGTNPGGPYPNSVTDTTTPFFEGFYSLVMTGLSASTPYYYRAKIHHTTYGWLEGNEVTFTTLSAFPQVRTDPPSDVTTTDIDAVGNILSTGGDATCDKRGFVYGLTSRPNPGDVAPGGSGYDSFEEESGAFGTGAFTLTIGSLTPSKIYFLRAYTHNSYGYVYGSELAILTSDTVNLLYLTGVSSGGIRFDSSPGGGYPALGGGTIAHDVLCNTLDSDYVAGGVWGYITGNYVYERNYYNDNYYTDLYTLQNPYRRTEGVVKVKWKAHVIRNGYPFGKYKRELYTHATQYTSSAMDITGYAPTVCEIFYNNPNTGAPWTLSELDALIAGITLGYEGGYGIAACDLVRVYALWANADVESVWAKRLTGDSARLDGQVNEDEAEPCQVYFEWGLTVAYGNTTVPQTKYKGEDFHDTIAGLDPARIYHARTVIETPCGETFYGADMTIDIFSDPWHKGDLLVKDSFI